MSKRLIPGHEYPKVNEDGGVQLTSDITLQDYMKWFGDRTLLSGGAISDNGDGTAAIASLVAWTKATDSDAAIGIKYSWAGGNTPSLTDLTTNHIYIDYNDGAPQLVVGTAVLTYGLKLDHVHLGVIYRNGSTLHIRKVDNIGIGRMGRADIHHVEESPSQRVAGLVTTDGGSLALSITTGVLYEGLTRHTSTIDGSTWSTWYYDGDLGTPAWVEVTGQSAISNSQYNDVATGLANLTVNRYAVHWVYSDIDGDNMFLVYGQGDYKINEAEEAGVPSSLPDIAVNYGVLIAKIIVQQGQTSMTITYPWVTVFTSNFATDHGSLGGLTDVADHAYSVLIDGSRAMTEVTLTPQGSSSGPEGTVFYNSGDDHLYVGTEV